jgi:hypothetical protein
VWRKGVLGITTRRRGKMEAVMVARRGGGGSRAVEAAGMVEVVVEVARDHANERGRAAVAAAGQLVKIVVPVAAAKLG